jgi:hypothetical protein
MLLTPVEGEYPGTVVVVAQVIAALLFATAGRVEAPQFGVNAHRSAAVFPPAGALEHGLGLADDGVFETVPDERAGVTFGPENDIYWRIYDLWNDPTPCLY